MYEGWLAGDLYGLVGVGGCIGYNWRHFRYIYFGDRISYRNGKGGVNAILELEYKCDIPLALQFDFRPGYRCVFNRHFADHKFDWNQNFGLRYTF